MSDWMIYLFVFIGVGVGYLAGEFSGFSRAHSSSSNVQPILNVSMYPIDENRFSFVDSTNGKFMMAGNIEECIAHIRVYSDKTIIFTKEVDEDTPKESSK